MATTDINTDIVNNTEKVSEELGNAKPPHSFL